jgi:hypothetical protein
MHKHLSMLRVINNQSLVTRYYIDGKRTSKENFDYMNILAYRRDTFHTVSTKKHVRTYHAAYILKGSNP